MKIIDRKLLDHLTILGEGEYAYCYYDKQQNIIYKIFKRPSSINFDSIENLKKQLVGRVSKPIELLMENGITIGYTASYIEGISLDKLFENLSAYDVTNFCDNFRTMYTQLIGIVTKISNNGVSLGDTNYGNIIFNDNKKTFSLIDFDQYTWNLKADKQTLIKTNAELIKKNILEFLLRYSATIRKKYPNCLQTIDDIINNLDTLTINAIEESKKSKKR